MIKKNTLKLALVGSLLCIMFCGCGKDNSDNKKTADNTASSTDSVIENTESSVSAYTNMEANSLTSTSTSDGIETENSNAKKDDDTSDNDNKPNNGGNSGNNTTESTKPSTTESTQPSTTTDNTYPSSTEESKPEVPTTTEATTEDTKPETPTTTEEPKPEKPSTTESPTTEEHKECTHSHRSEVTETRYIEPVYETRTVCVQEAYDEPIYEWHSFCNGCGMDLTINFPDGHYISHTTVCQGGSTYHADKVLVNTIHHEAVYETKEVLVSGGYSETISKIVCDDCGAVLYSSN